MFQAAFLLLFTSVALHASSATVFTNGRILTVDSAFSISDAVAIEGSRIIAVGEEAKALLASNPNATHVDLRGRTLLPGLMDSHSHPVGAATAEFDHSIPNIEDIPQLLEYIAARTTILPEGSLISVSQIFITRLREQRYPTREELDRVAPKHPVQFSTGPDSMLNSVALKMAGIDRHFKIPDGTPGVVVMDENGEPTGLMHSFSPKLGVTAVVKQPDSQQTLDLLKKLFSDYNSVGFTTIADRGATPKNLDLYQALRESSSLTVRLRLSHSFASGGQWRTTEAVLDEILRHPLCKSDPMLQIIGTKIWLDGGMLTGSALMEEPWGVSRIYGITDASYKGVQRTPSEHLGKMVKKVSGAGLQFTAHSVGDGAVKLLLDVYESVGKEIPIAATRPCLTHSNFMTPESIQKAARLGVVVDMQPIWFYLDGATLLKQFGNERMSRFQPLRSLFDAKVTVGGGSDHMQKIGSMRSINPYNPWLGMWISIAREGRFLNAPLHPEGGVSRVEAIQMYTINNARILFLEKETGSLEAGKRADFIIIDRDILNCPLDDIKDTQVQETWLDGKRVWPTAATAGSTGKN